MTITPSSKPYAPGHLKILFYAPFKPLGHAHPSGDLHTATGIYDFLEKQGHELIEASSLRCRWIYWKPWLWPQIFSERRRIYHRFAQDGVDLWLTYHSYYKAPDMLGTVVSRKLKTPYIIFQGIYSTKRRRRLKTRIGFYLNRKTLCTADHVFSNKRADLLNLKRLLPESRITYVYPGVKPNDFCFDAGTRTELRTRWEVGDDPVILSAAMFRPGAKTEGLSWVIRACGELYGRGHKLWLVIAGDGKGRAALQKIADDLLPRRVRFTGKLSRREMSRFYCAGDIFVFPGINEPLGMVYLEAQSCGLPVVAFENAGVPEAVQNGRTGILVPMYNFELFTDAILRLLTKGDLRQKMGRAAKSYVRETHDMNKNYQMLESVMQRVIRSRRKES
jgi:glycosyltransferase involved in cell wall biosynthesis